MGVNSHCRNTVAPKMSLPKRAKGSLKLLPKVSAGAKSPLQQSQWLCPFAPLRMEKNRVWVLALQHQEVHSITNCQILPCPRQRLWYLESRCSFYFISVLPMGASELRRTLLVPSPRNIRQGRGRQCWQVCSNQRMNTPCRLFPLPWEMQRKRGVTESYSDQKELCVTAAL